MSSYFSITLDITAPQNPSIVIEDGGSYAGTQMVHADISVSDGDVTGYQMKVWGDVDPSYNTDIQYLEANSSWIAFSQTLVLKLSAGDGTKNIYLKVRDDVLNVSVQATDTIIYDGSLPVPTTTGVSRTRISKQVGANITSGSFQSDSPFVEFKIKLVDTPSAIHSSGTQIGTANGSTNMTGTGSVNAGVPVNFSITGADLEAAAGSAGTKVVKIFVKEASGNWSV